MNSVSPEFQISFLINIQRLLSEGSYVATYKYALLLALAEISVERGTDDDGELTITTRLLAEKFIRYYWRQSAPYLSSDMVLQQNTGKQAGVINKVRSSHERYEGSLSNAQNDNKQWNLILSQVAYYVRTMPLWKLQTVGSEKLDFLYANTYQSDDIKLKPGVVYCFRKHYPLVSDLVKSAWLRYVRRYNAKALGDQTDLYEFLFGSERTNLRKAAEILSDFQQGDCFYCRSALKEATPHVDHFIPWSRYPVDLGHNLVLAHGSCNINKSDLLAAQIHLNRWCEFQSINAIALAGAFDRAGIPNDINSSLKIVNWAYTQTYNAHGLTWLRKKEMLKLGNNWREILGTLLN